MGAQSTRDWICTSFRGDERSQAYTDLWTLATAIDYALAACSNDTALTQKLGTDDFVEIGLRRLASWMHSQRTHDADSANAMLAIRAPGQATDVAPQWLITEASAFSEAEYKQSVKDKDMMR